MPGIVGIISQKPAKECESLVKLMVHSMLHERFYAFATHSAPDVGVSCGWIAHPNSFAAGQVFFNERRDLALLFSGECFVDSETAASLRRQRHAFVPNDGSWLLQLYAEYGERFFEKLNGLFSGLLIDKRDRKVFLFNDRYGMERIYWHETNDAFYFASEAKALLRVLPQLREFDTDGVAQFLSFGCTLGSRTLFRGIETLPTASLWCFNGEKYQKRKYFSPETWESQEVLPAKTFEEQFAATFHTLLPRYLGSCSKLGISLTAGLDSRMIMSCLGKVTPAPVCYTFSGEKRDPLDARIAAQVASACGLEHHILRLGRHFFEEFPSHADRTVYITDGTLGVLGAHEMYFNRQARELAPVRLTGVFGGEIMRGVSFFRPVWLSANLLSPDLQRLVAGIKRRNMSCQQHPISYAAFTETPQKRFGTPAAGRSQLTFRTPYLDNEFVKLCYRAPRPAAGSPAELALHFIRDNNPALASIATDRGYLNGERTLLRRTFAEVMFKLDYFYSEGLPRRATRFDFLFRRATFALGIAERHKFLHYRAWFQQELAAYLDDRLADLGARQSSFWKASSLKAIFDDHRTGRANYLHEINSVLTLEAVERLLLRQRSNGETSSISTTPRSVIASR